VSKRIVMVCGYRIFPPKTGGNVHSTTIAQALARLGHDVLVYCLAGRREDYAGFHWLRQNALRRTIEPRLVEEVNLGADYGLFQAAFRRLGVPRRNLIPARLRTVLSSADIIVSDFPFCPPVPGPWSDKPWFMISHELEFRLFEQGTRLERLLARRMQAIERVAPTRYRDIFVCAEEDREFFRTHDPTGQLKLPYIRCGVDSRAYRAAPGAREGVRAQLSLESQDWLIVFSGSRYGPNLEALKELRKFCRSAADFLSLSGGRGCRSKSHHSRVRLQH